MKHEKGISGYRWEMDMDLRTDHAEANTGPLGDAVGLYSVFSWQKFAESAVVCDGADCDADRRPELDMHYYR